MQRKGIKQTLNKTHFPYFYTKTQGDMNVKIIHLNADIFKNLMIT